MAASQNRDIKAATPQPSDGKSGVWLSFLQRHAGVIGLSATVLAALATAISAWAAMKQTQIADLVANYQSVATSFPFKTQEITNSLTGFTRMLAICGSEAELLAITEAKSTWQSSVRVTRSEG